MLEARQADARRLDELAAERDAAQAELTRVHDQLAAKVLAIELERDEARAEATLAGADGQSARQVREDLELRLASALRERDDHAHRADEAENDAERSARERAAAEDAVARMQRRITELELAEVRAAELEGEDRGTRSVQAL